MHLFQLKTSKREKSQISKLQIKKPPKSCFKGQKWKTKDTRLQTDGHMNTWIIWNIDEITM